MNSKIAASPQPNLGSQPFSLSGHVALVTGSSRGLGRALAFALGNAGAKVAFNYFNDAKKAQQTFSDFVAGGGRGMLVRGDVTSEQDVTKMAEAIRAELGPVDILVINATCDQPHKPI